jgi:TolA-binding protein
MSSKKNSTLEQPIATIPLPSADLLNYRLDQTDKKIDDLSVKIDGLTGSFLTKEEALMVRQQFEQKLTELQTQTVIQGTTLKALTSENDQVKGAIKLLKGGMALLSVIGVILGALWWVKG